jgi:predicted nucleotidyltransferase
MLNVPAERPVEPLTIALLRDVKDACAQLGTQFVLAGATARDILMWHLHDVKAPVATRDVDVAVCAVSWEFHDTLIDLLLQTKRFRRHPKQQQKFLFKRSPDDYEIELDVPLTQTFVRDRLALLCCREHALATRKKGGAGRTGSGVLRGVYRRLQGQ